MAAVDMHVIASETTVPGSMLGYSGNDLAMIWACSGQRPGMSTACPLYVMFSHGKSTFQTFPENRFLEERFFVSLVIPGIVVSLVIPESSSHS